MNKNLFEKKNQQINVISMKSVTEVYSIRGNYMNARALVRSTAGERIVSIFGKTRSGEILNYLGQSDGVALNVANVAQCPAHLI